MGVLRGWLDHGAALPPGEVDGVFRGLVLEGLAEGLERQALEA